MVVSARDKDVLGASARDILTSFDRLGIDIKPSLAISESTYHKATQRLTTYQSINAEMKALRAVQEDSSYKVIVTDVPKPQIRPGEVLVKIRASAIQPSDILNSKGGFSHTSFPRTLGRDYSGTVVEGSDQWKGKDVFGTSGPHFSFSTDGAQAEYAVLSEDALAEKPENISFAQAASLGTPLTTANLTLQRAQLKPSDTVMVIGASGSVGAFVVQIAKAHGSKVITVGRHGTDISSLSDPELKSARELTGGKGPDVVVDTVGDFDLVRAAINVLNDRGRFSFITAPRQSSTVLPIDIFSFYRRSLSFLGCNSVEESQADLAEMLKGLSADLQSGKIKPAGEKELNLIGLDQAPKAYAAKTKKAVVVFD